MYTYLHYKCWAIRAKGQLREKNKILAGPLMAWQLAGDRCKVDFERSVAE